MSVPMTPPIAIVKTPVLKQTEVRVYTEGELVCVQIGNSTLKLPYEDALTISGWIRLRAKEAKRLAGDNSRSWRVIGDLTAKED